MTKAKTPTSSSQDPVQMGEAVMAQLEDAGFGPLRWMGTAWLDAISEANAEVFNFIAQRLQEDVKTQHDLMTSTSVEEMQKVQLAYLHKMQEDYAAQTGRMVALGLEMSPMQLKLAKATLV